MTKETFQLNASAASVYEEQKVKAMFAPLAKAILEIVKITQDDRILDIACGTGIVSRTIHENVAPHATISGIDVNESMLNMAKQITEDRKNSFSWHLGDVAVLPFKSGSFTAVFCQQGIQYFPDEGAALKEMRRVLENNGQLIMSVWGGASDFFIAMADSVSRHISSDLGAKYLAPFSYKNIEQLPGMLETAEFKSVSVEEIIVDRVISDPSLSIPKEILGHPAGQKVQEAGEEIIQAIANDVSVACARYQIEADMVVPQRAFLIQAKAA